MTATTYTSSSSSTTHLQSVDNPLWKRERETRWRCANRHRGTGTRMPAGWGWVPNGGCGARDGASNTHRAASVPFCFSARLCSVSRFRCGMSLFHHSTANPLPVRSYPLLGGQEKGGEGMRFAKHGRESVTNNNPAPCCLVWFLGWPRSRG